MNIYVVRHGQTDWNVNGILQGSSNIELNNTGKKQAKNLLNELENTCFDYIICSPLKRTIQTAEILKNNSNIPMVINNSLIERYYGDLEGTSRNDISKYWNYTENCNDFNVEPIQSFFKRIFNFMDDIKENYKDKNVLIVTHYGVMIGIDCYVNGFKKNYNLDGYEFNNGTCQKYII